MIEPPPPRDYRIRVTFRQALRILEPYVRSKIYEQVVACLPVTAYLALFQIVVLRRPVEQWLPISAGMFGVLLGLTFFMEGLRLGLMPFGETIGDTLPRKASMAGVLSFAFVVGVGATLAEPAIGILRDAGSTVAPDRAPLLAALLGPHSLLMVLAVGLGVGAATAVGILRFLRGWRLAPVALPALVIALALTGFAQASAMLRPVVGVAWDCGAVTTGPVTVPLVLSLGLGVTRCLGASDTGMSGFGIVTLASMFPVIAVLLLASFLAMTGSGAAGPAAAAASGAADPGAVWITKSLLAIRLAMQAVLPLALLLFLVQRFWLRERLRRPDEVMLGTGFCLVGMALFNLGLTFGLSALGGQVGGKIPVAFAPPDQLYGPTGGRVVAVLFAFLLGYGATLAEPALNAMGNTVEEVTQGAFRKFLLMHAVAFGVGVGVALGVAKILWGLPLAWMLIVPYALLIPVTLFSSERFANIGWDSAGVTTGPVTVPLVIALGLGIGVEVGAADGFGILSMASVCPIASVLLLGLVVDRRLRRAQEAEVAAGRASLALALSARGGT
jgi:hypothetical protein